MKTHYETKEQGRKKKDPVMQICMCISIFKADIANPMKSSISLNHTTHLYNTRRNSENKRIKMLTK